MHLVIAGAIAMAFAAVGLFFFRFWHKTKDRLLGFFSLAFWIFAIERLCLTFLVVPMNEVEPMIYTLRLAGFLMILFGIMEKNRAR